MRNRTDETVDAYINRLRNLSKRVSVDDKTLLYALLCGLLAPLASCFGTKPPIVR